MLNTTQEQISSIHKAFTQSPEGISTVREAYKRNQKRKHRAPKGSFNTPIIVRRKRKAENAVKVEFQQDQTMKHINPMVGWCLYGWYQDQTLAEQAIQDQAGDEYYLGAEFRVTPPSVPGGDA